MNLRGKGLFSLSCKLLILIAVATATIGCGSSPKKPVEFKADEELVTANRMARFAFDNGKFEQAAKIYRNALERSYARNDTAAILDASFNLAVCLMELRQYEEATALVNRAKEELAAQTESFPPDLLLLEGTIFYRDQRFEYAWEATEEILGDRSNLSPSIRARTHFLRGLISDRRQDADGLRKSIRKMGQPQSETLKSDMAELRGRLAMAEKDWNQAVIYMDEATAIRRMTLDYRRMAAAMALSAEACEKGGRQEEAAVRYLQAGRSAASRNDLSNARTWLTKSSILFERVGNDFMASESRSILSELDQKPEERTNQPTTDHVPATF